MNLSLYIRTNPSTANKPINKTTQTARLASVLRQLRWCEQESGMSWVPGAALLTYMSPYVRFYLKSCNIICILFLIVTQICVLFRMMLLSFQKFVLFSPSCIQSCGVIALSVKMFCHLLLISVLFSLSLSSSISLLPAL